MYGSRQTKGPPPGGVPFNPGGSLSLAAVPNFSDFASVALGNPGFLRVIFWDRVRVDPAPRKSCPATPFRGPRGHFGEF